MSLLGVVLGLVSGLLPQTPSLSPPLSSGDGGGAGGSDAPSEGTGAEGSGTSVGSSGGGNGGAGGGNAPAPTASPGRSVALAPRLAIAAAPAREDLIDLAPAVESIDQIRARAVAVQLEILDDQLVESVASEAENAAERDHRSLLAADAYRREAPTTSAVGALA